MKLILNECLRRGNLEETIRIDFHMKIDIGKDTQKKKFEFFSKQTRFKSHTFNKAGKRCKFAKKVREDLCRFSAAKVAVLWLMNPLVNSRPSLSQIESTPSSQDGISTELEEI